MQKRVLPESRALTAACSDNCGHLLTVLLRTKILPLRLTMSKHAHYWPSARTHACHMIPTSSLACSHTCQGASKRQGLRVSCRLCMHARQYLGCMGGDRGAGASAGVWSQSCISCCPSVVSHLWRQSSLGCRATAAVDVPSSAMHACRNHTSYTSSRSRSFSAFSPVSFFQELLCEQYVQVSGQPPVLMLSRVHLWTCEAKRRA